jgi:hypothetical protein
MRLSEARGCAIHFARKLQPFTIGFLVSMVAGWISRQQVIVIEYLKAENRMLRERLKRGLAAHATARPRSSS